MSLLLGCSKHTDYKEIEMLSYRLYYYLTDVDSINKLDAKCYFYLTINKKDEAVIFKIIQQKVTCKKIYVPSSMIENILLDADTIKDNINLSFDSKRELYEGPEIKLRITYLHNSTKTVNFYDRYDTRSINFRELYSYIEGIKTEPCNFPHDSIILLTKKLMDFKSYSLKVDTTEFQISLPPKIYTGSPSKYVVPN
jgi:hypothetical protein